MARSINHRRSIGAILVVQLTALLCPRSHFGVQSFVLRSRSIDDLAAALANVDENERSDLDDVIEDDGNDRVDFLDQPSSWSNQWSADYGQQRPMTGIYNDFEDMPEDDDRIHGDEDDLTLDDKVFDAIARNGDDDVIVDDSDELGHGESSETVEDGKIPLNKSELKELFDIVTPETVTGAIPAITVAKKSELSKNEVESLFEKMADMTIAPDKEELKAVIVSGAGNTSETGGSSSATASVASPTVKVTTIEEVVKAVAKDNNGDAGSGSGEKDVVLDVKEEKISPSGNEKLTKEWLVQLAQPEDEKQDDGSNGDLYAVEDRWRGGNRKFKRSLPPALSDAGLEEMEMTADGKTRAVELLKAYIRLQEEENRHLTEALDLATLGQAEKTDRFLDGQIKLLRQAVEDERSIEAIRAMIRAEEDLEENNDDDVDGEDFAGESQPDDSQLDEMPLAIKRSQSEFDDDENLPPMPELIAFDAGNADDNGYAIADSEGGNDVIADGDDEEERLKEELREYALQNELDEIRQAAEAAVEAEVEDNDRSPQTVYITPPMKYRTTFRDFRFNPFLRDFEEKLGYRPRVVAEKRFEPIRIQKYAVDDEEEEDNGDEEAEAEEARRREVLAEVEAAVKAAEEEEQRRAFIENLEEALQLPASLNAVDVNDVGEDERPLLDSAAVLGLCPVVQELTDNCLVARERGLTLDDEALQLCNRHQLCYSCGDQYGLTPDACDRGYLAEADRLCSDPMSSASSSSRCRREAASLYVMMLDGHRAHSGSGYAAPEACRQPCTFHFIVGTTVSARR